VATYLQDLFSMASPLPGGDAAAEDPLTKLLALIRPDAGTPTNVSGVEVAPLSIAPPIPNAVTPAPLPNSDHAALVPTAPQAPPTTPGGLMGVGAGLANNLPQNTPITDIGQPYTAPAAAQPAPVTTGSIPAPARAASNPGFSGGDVLKTIASFVGGLSGEGGISSALNTFNGLQNVNATRDALIRKGFSPEDADAAARNPTIMQQLAPIAFGNQAVSQAAIKKALIGHGISDADADAASRDPTIMAQLATSLFGLKTPIKLGPGESVVGTDKNGQTVDLTPASVANRAKLEPGQIVDASGNVTWAPGALDAMRAKNAAEGKTFSTSDKAAIRAADDKVRQGNQVIDQLNEALNLSNSAWQGAGGSAAGPISSALGDYAPQGAQDAARMDKIIMEGALPQLKQAFPSRITNADLAFFTKLQGISAQPQATREALIKEAIQRTRRITADAQSDANELRGQTYYTPGGGSGTSGSANGWSATRVR